MAGAGVDDESTTSQRRVELTAVRHVAGFRRCRYLLEGERIFLFNFLSFLLKATVIYSYGLRLLKSGELWKLRRFWMSEKLVKLR